MRSSYPKISSKEAIGITCTRIARLIRPVAIHGGCCHFAGSPSVPSAEASLRGNNQMTEVDRPILRPSVITWPGRRQAVD